MLELVVGMGICAPRRVGGLSHELWLFLSVAEKLSVQVSASCALTQVISTSCALAQC